MKTNEKNGNEVYLQLAAGQSCIVRTFDKELEGAEWVYLRPRGDAETVKGKWDVGFVKGGPELPAAVETDELKSWTEWNGEAGKNFSGTAKYTLQFGKPTDADAETKVWRLDLGQVADRREWC